MLNNSRHVGIFSPEEFKSKMIHICGLGNIGSHTAIALTRMGFENFTLYDFDKVEEVNVATQCFNGDDENEHKIVAVRRQMLKINPAIKVELNFNKLEEGSLLSDAVSLCFISAVDSIEARRSIRHLLIGSYLSQVPVIDGRMGKEQVEVLFSENAEDWDTEIDEEELADVGCTEKYIAYTPLMSAALISGTVKKLCKKEEIPKHAAFEFSTNAYLTII